tara:strand:- start:50680 stop:51858 length:1179 start_codon:yes stop_codon:yes gene_type:complete
MSESITMMEPMLPLPISAKLQDLGIELTAKGSSLASMLHPVVQASIGNLVRSMNCYYSNLIEDHNTHPRDIDQALKNNLSNEPEKRNLQLEAASHIYVQSLIDKATEPQNPTSADYILWLHNEFCKKLPEELLWVENPTTGERLRITPGALRENEVAVGRHEPPLAENLHHFLKRFEDAYDIQNLGRMEKIITAAASHHRLLWIHPFYDGNGRVARLMVHAILKEIGIGSSLWSVARGLARNVDGYKAALMAADQPRHGDLDGRGSLSQKELENFCEFFLKVCIDQIDFMHNLLNPTELINRIEIYTEEEIRAKRLPTGSFPLLREALMAGSFERGQASTLTGYKDRQARTILKSLIDAGLLISDTPKGSVRLGFPIDVLNRWFPSLYPTAI